MDMPIRYLGALLCIAGAVLIFTSGGAVGIPIVAVGVALVAISLATTRGHGTAG
jgi:hypothetical protein